MTINREVNDQQLQEIFYAQYAIEKQKGRSNKEAKETANLIAYGIFRNLLTYDSVIENIVKNARKVFYVETPPIL